MDKLEKCSLLIYSTGDAIARRPYSVSFYHLFEINICYPIVKGEIKLFTGIAP